MHSDCLIYLPFVVRSYSQPTRLIFDFHILLLSIHFVLLANMRAVTTSVLLAAAPVALGQQSVYGQCGGTGWTGATTCAAGSTCVELNAYYSQCQPGTASTTMVTQPAAPTTSTAPAQTTAPSTTVGGTGPTGTASGVGPGATLQAGYSWIRAVEDPYFHQYLQTNPEYTTGIALLGNDTSAGQFNVVGGQLVELIDPTKGTLLYATVSPQANSSETILPITFTTAPNTYGTWSLSGDTVDWSIPTIARPNTAAFYVCTGTQLFINLGAYDYGTPPDCSDQTVSISSIDRGYQQLIMLHRFIRTAVPQQMTRHSLGHRHVSILPYSL